jgi:hypothetical protein
MPRRVDWALPDREKSAGFPPPAWQCEDGWNGYCFWAAPQRFFRLGTLEVKRARPFFGCRKIRARHMKNFSLIERFKKKTQPEYDASSSNLARHRFSPRADLDNLRLAGH